ncbi:MAG: hypothetical protein BM556_05375 [Bacteriovorax sp. MedPE-SWde]|nr:MAG: hypothetical protein BM556_05375 [Bacteriovorax sp. MedPE-SWde]
MKKLLLAATLLLSVSSTAAVDWDKLEITMEEAATQAAVLTDLHFCVTMSHGVSYTSNSDAGILKALGCEDKVQEARDVKNTEEEINNTIIRALKVVSLNEIEKCGSAVITGEVDSCSSQIEEAKDLGLTEEDIREELGLIGRFAIGS